MDLWHRVPTCSLGDLTQHELITQFHFRSVASYCLLAEIYLSPNSYQYVYQLQSFAYRFAWLIHCLLANVR